MRRGRHHAADATVHTCALSLKFHASATLNLEITVSERQQQLFEPVVGRQDR